MEQDVGLLAAAQFGGEAQRVVHPAGRQGHGGEPDRDRREAADGRAPQGKHHPGGDTRGQMVVRDGRQRCSRPNPLEDESAGILAEQPNATAAVKGSQGGGFLFLSTSADFEDDVLLVEEQPSASLRTARRLAR